VITPLANRVLIKPDPPPEQTASGLHIPDNASSTKDFEMAGTVVKVGNGPASAHRVRAAMIARFHKLIDVNTLLFEDHFYVLDMHARLNALEAQTQNLSELAPGDHVAFPYTAGTVVELDGERYLLMPEDQIVAILDREDVHE
jgi:co-chaperonin GroES (HSP10)